MRTILLAVAIAAYLLIIWAINRFSGSKRPLLFYIAVLILVILVSLALKDYPISPPPTLGS